MAPAAVCPCVQLTVRDKWCRRIRPSQTAVIRLLSDELGPYAFKAQQDIARVLTLGEATGEAREGLAPAIEESAESYGTFIAAAHDFLMGRRIPKLSVDTSYVGPPPPLEATDG